MRRFIFLVMFSLFFSCYSEVSKPNNLISKDKLKLIVKDVYLYRQLGSINVSNEIVDMVNTNNAILQKHGVSVQEFKDSFKYYVIDGASYGDFLDEIKEELEGDPILADTIK